MTAQIRFISARNKFAENWQDGIYVKTNDEGRVTNELGCGGLSVHTAAI
jgi:hypothetical protein